MSDNGYVYVLMNPSLQNMVKIGKTTREPEERAKELSSVTGVPTPFIVVYSCMFESCSDAETFVHTYLETKGFRVASNREFFEIPINIGIDAVIKAKEHFGEFIINDNAKQSTNKKNEEELVDLYKLNILPEIEEYMNSLEIDSDIYSFYEGYIKLIDTYIENKLFILSSYNIANFIEHIEPLRIEYHNKFEYLQESSVSDTDISTASNLFYSLIENHESTINSIKNTSTITLLDFLYELIITMNNNEETKGVIAIVSEYIDLVNQETEVFNIEESPKKSPWFDVFIQATNYFNGENGYFQDYNESIKYFKKAVSLGSITAYYFLGTIYRYGKGTKINLDLALSYYKESANKGDISSYTNMADIYLEMNHIENAIKCWEKYLDNINDENITAITSMDLDFSMFIDALINTNQLIPNKIRIKNISDRIYVLMKVNYERFTDNLDDLNKCLNNTKLCLYNDVIKFTNSNENNSVESKFSLASLFGFK